MAARTLDDLLAEARRKIARLSPAEAKTAADEGGLIVDIRSDSARERDGVVPGSIHIPRTVFEWRCEPGGSWGNPRLGAVDRRLVVLCDHGYSSIFAAAMLADLGYTQAADVVGGFEAWVGSGLPVISAPPRADPGNLPGMDGPV